MEPRTLQDTLNGYGYTIQKIGSNSVQSAINNWNTAYGSKLIDTQECNIKYSWSIEIDNIAPKEGVAIGLQGNSCGDKSNTCWYAHSRIGYAFRSFNGEGCVYENGNKTEDDAYQGLKSNDIMDIILDCVTKQITLFINEREIINFENIKQDKYILAIAIKGYTKCTLINSGVLYGSAQEDDSTQSAPASSFSVPASVPNGYHGVNYPQIAYSQTIPNQNQNMNVAYQSLKALQCQYNGVLQRYQNSQVLIQQMADKQKVYLNQIQSLKIENQTLRMELNNDEGEDYKQKYYDLLQDHNQLSAKQKKTEEKLYRIKNEHQELEIKYNEMKSQYKRIIRSKDYNMWDVEDIVNWIIDLNVENYSKYEQDLIQNMINEEIDGSCLKFLEINDIHRLGVIGFKDKKEIFQHLQQLIDNSP